MDLNGLWLLDLDRLVVLLLRVLYVHVIRCHLWGVVAGRQLDVVTGSRRRHHSLRTVDLYHGHLHFHGTQRIVIIVEGVPITLVSSESKNIFHFSRNNNKRVEFNNTGEPFHMNA